MKKTKFLLSILGLSMFVPVEVLAYQNDIKVSSIKSLTYKESVGNFLKFKMQDNKLYVNHEYTHLFQSELQKLYYKALESSSTTLTLAHELAKLSKKQDPKNAIKKDTIYRYLHRFNFAQAQKAMQVKELLKTFIKQNNLFEVCT